VREQLSLEKELIGILIGEETAFQRATASPMAIIL
jgi:hypothetical protein